MSGSSNTIRRQSGFTVVEMLVAIILMGTVLVGLLSVFSNYFAIMTRNSRSTELTVESQNLLRATVEELRYGAGVRNTNSISDPNQPTGWNTSNTNFVIIIAVPAVDSSNNYIINPNTGEPYNNELVYFREGTTLYKRSLANPLASDNKMLTSCPAASATATCPADRLLTENGETFNFTLYNQDNNTTIDPLLARSVKIDLVLQRDTFGAPVTFSNSIRVAFRNNFL